MTKVDWNKPIQTRDGLEAKYLCECEPCQYGATRIVQVTDKDGRKIWACHEDGKFGTTGASIINVPEPRYRPYTEEELERLVGTAVRDVSNAWRSVRAILWVSDNHVAVAGFPEALKVNCTLGHLEHLDGTPFGMLVDEREEQHGN